MTRRGRIARLTCYSPAVDAQFLTIIGTVLAVGFGLAGLMIRTTARLDRRIDNDKKVADEDRRTYQAAADADRRAHQARFDTAMDAFRAEMQRSPNGSRTSKAGSTDAGSPPTETPAAARSGNEHDPRPALRHHRGATGTAQCEICSEGRP